MRCFLAGFSVACLAALAFGQMHMERGKEFRGGNFPEMLMFQGKEALGLSDEQIDKAKALFLQHRKNTIKLRADLELAQLELEQALESDKPNKATVDPLSDKVGGLENQLRKEKLHLQMDLRSLLTKEQKQKAKAFRCPMKKRMMEKQGCKHGDMEKDDD